MEKEKILIVEDERLVAEDIRSCLVHFGYRVVSIVTSGEKALKELKEHSPDLILMDIGLNGGMDGIETARAINKSSDVPIIYLTGNNDEGTRKRAMKTKHYGYLQKPFFDEDLREIIEVVLHKDVPRERPAVDEERHFNKSSNFRLAFCAAA